MDEVRANLCHLMQHIEGIPLEGQRELLGKILAPLQPIGWEVGPDATSHDKTTLALTSIEDPARLQQVAGLLGLPIDGPTWAIVAGAPPRAWELYFEIEIPGIGSTGVEASDWGWELVGVAEKAKIRLVLPARQGVLKPVIDEAVAIALCGELGEINVHQRIEVGAVSWAAEPQVRPVLPLRKLRKEFVRWFPDSPHAGYLLVTES